MPKVTFHPSGKTVSARVGQTLMQASRPGRVVIPQRCGGHASCLMCKVYIEKGEVSEPTPLELRKMPERDLREGVRLACQATLTNQDCTIRIPEDKLKSVVAAALERQRQEEEGLW